MTGARWRRALPWALWAALLLATETASAETASAQPNSAQPNSTGRAQSVVVRVPAGESAALAETAVRLMAELRVAGYAPVLQQRSPDLSGDGPEDSALATIALHAADDSRTTSAEVWVAGQRGGTAQGPRGGDNQASTLAIRTIELLHASLPERAPLAARSGSDKAAAKAAAAAAGSKAKRADGSFASLLDAPALTAPEMQRVSDADGRSDDTAIPATAGLGLSVVMFSGDWPAALAIDLRATFPLASVWSLQLEAAATPARVRLDQDGGGPATPARVTQGQNDQVEMFTQQLLRAGFAYSPMGRDSLLAPSAGLSMGVRHALIEREPIERGNVHIWSFVVGPSLSLRAQLTHGFALYAKGSALLTLAPPEHNDGGLLMGEMGAGAAAMF